MDRTKALEKIAKTNWYKRVPEEVKNIINGLGDSWTGYLIDLANQKDIAEVFNPQLGDFIFIPRLKDEITFEKKTAVKYFSWNKKLTKDSKCLVFITDKLGKIDAFAYVVFAPAGKNNASYDNPVEKIDVFLNRIIQGIKEETGSTSTTIMSIEQLCQYPSNDKTENSLPFLFSMILAVDFASDIKSNNEHKIKVYPIGELKKFISMCDDDFFLSTIIRLFQKNPT